ncbi:hypothetical protein EYF80_023700 [Liparis tanakae]|uniref:Uncharacterized protein n=1 Tax=Liparis tanakae TaxID=230148 RepID=A0A4Z2HMQ6_9TELE|nr:hypothetical protein EYF80_023700 [Liparis tanakae]
MLGCRSSTITDIPKQQLGVTDMNSQTGCKHDQAVSQTHLEENMEENMKENGQLIRSNPGHRE